MDTQQNITHTKAELAAKSINELSNSEKMVDAEIL